MKRARACSGPPIGSRHSTEIALNTIYWLLVIAVLTVMTFAGWIRPTGLLGRTPAEREQEKQRRGRQLAQDRSRERTKGS